MTVFNIDHAYDTGINRFWQKNYVAVSDNKLCIKQRRPFCCSKDPLLQDDKLQVLRHRIEGCGKQFLENVPKLGKVAVGLRARALWVNALLVGKRHLERIGLRIAEYNARIVGEDLCPTLENLVAEFEQKKDFESESDYDDDFLI